MKPDANTSSHFPSFWRSLVVSAALFSASIAQTWSADVNASYNTGADVPVTAANFTAAGKTVNLTLNFAPQAGTDLVVVHNTGTTFIKGTFTNLAQGQMVSLTYAGVQYTFISHYGSGTDRDLVLLWTNAGDLPATVASKLDSQLVLASKQARGQAPFDKPTSLRPDVPLKDETGRLLVDIRGAVSHDLIDQVAALGGRVIEGTQSDKGLRALVPALQLQTLAAREDVANVAPTRLYETTRHKPGS